MRSRLLVIVSMLVLIAVLALGVPLAIAVASGATGTMFTDRLADTTRFAALGQRAIVDGDTDELTTELRRYEEVYGVAATVIDRQGLVLAASRPTIVPGSDPRVRAALLGQGSEPAATVYPWTRARMLLAEPVLVDGEVFGVAVTVSPTDSLAARVTGDWSLMFFAGSGVLLLGVGVCLPLVRWILAPVEQLDTATSRVVASVSAGRTPDSVGDLRGPPELRQLTRRFDQMAAGVGQALESQRAFVADAGHQLRNPLTALRLLLATVADEIEDLPDDVPAREALRRQQDAAIDEAQRFSGVLDELLALARAEGRSVVPGPVALGELLAERHAAWNVLARHAGRRLELRAMPGLVAESDAESVVAVLDAVLDNALKYAPAGDTVVLSSEWRDDRAEVAVRDHGPGLSAMERKRATDRFWRGAAHIGVDGSGLGLAIATRSAQRAGGELLLEAPDDGGLRVVLRLPLASPDPGAARTPVVDR